MIEIQIDDAQLTAALERLIRAGGKPQRALQEAGELLVESTKRRFRDKRTPDGTRWPDNTAITQAAKGGKNNPLIGESKRLSREIHYRARDSLLEVGTSLEYAATQHFGARRGEFGATAKGGKIPWGTIPPREFIGLSDDDRVGLLEIIAEHITQAINESA